MRVLIIDGQGGRMGALLVKKIKESAPQVTVTAVGTNSIATSAMLKAGADAGATGENPVVRAAMTADIIAGPIGIIAAHSIMGEVTPAMAEAVGGSSAVKVLVPVTNCSIRVAGTLDMKLSDYIDSAVGDILTLI
ncbi:MAG: DUF3842 family protein [Oscillospiraceae bacterium]